MPLNFWCVTMASVVLAVTPSSLAVAEDTPSIPQIVAALDASDLSASELRSIVSYERLDVVDIAKFEDDVNFELLEKALANVDDGWARVQTAVVENETIREELRRRSVSIQKIEAASRSGDVITIYVR